MRIPELRRWPGLVKEGLLFELALYRSLARWVVRRPDIPQGSTGVGYARLVGPMLWLWIFGSATEVVVFEVILRSIDAAWAEAVRLPLLVLGVWGLVWMLGLLASYRTRPHLLDDERLVVRAGARTWIEVPRRAISAVQAREHELPGSLRSVHQDGELLLVGVSGRTNLELVLDGARVLASSRGEVVADRVGLWVDEPREAVRLLAASTPR